MSLPGAAAIAALFGWIAALRYLVVPSGWLGAMILVFLTQLPLFAAELWLGVEASVTAGAVGLLILLAGGSSLAAATFAGLNAIPVALLVRQSLITRASAGSNVGWYQPGLSSAWLTGLGIAVVAAVVLVLGGVDGIRAALREALTPALNGGLDGNTAGLDQLSRTRSRSLAGLAAASWMAMTATNGILAQGVLARFGANRRPSPDLPALRLPI